MNLKGKIMKLENDLEYYVQEVIEYNQKTYIYASEITKTKNIKFYQIIDGNAIDVDDNTAKILTLILAKKLNQ